MVKAAVLLAAALLLCAAFTAARAQSDSTAQGVIAGRVIDEAGQPVAYALVNVNGPRGHANISSDVDGRFTTDKLPRSAYSISAAAPGYYDASNLTTERGERTYYQIGDTVTLRLRKGCVITGRVTNANGEPLVAVHVNALRVRPLTGQLGDNTFLRLADRTTDDRGIYRFYGLLPGVYLVSAGGQGLFVYNLRPTPYDDDVPTFYPSTTRDGATEVTVQDGQEATDIDIRYRGEPGQSLSGAVVGGATPDRSGAIMISISPAGNNYNLSSRFLAGSDSDQSFVFNGLADGDYDLLAQQSGRDGTLSAVSQRVSVRGRDVTGIKLTLAPLASITGRVLLEAAPADAPWRAQCAGRLDATASEATLIVRRERDARRDALLPAGLRGAEVAPDEQGAFNVRGLAAGRFRLDVRPSNTDWYVRTATLNAPTNARANAPTTTSRTSVPAGASPVNVNPLQDSLTLNAGAQLGGLMLTLTPGAAAMRGRVEPAMAGASLPELEIYLVPAERERADDPLRYAVARVRRDGAFSFNYLAPGRYHLLAHPVSTGDPTRDQALPLRPDAQTRAQLRRETATSDAFDLQPCQQRDDYVLRYTPTH